MKTIKMITAFVLALVMAAAPGLGALADTQLPEYHRYAYKAGEISEIFPYYDGDGKVLEDKLTVRLALGGDEYVDFSIDAGTVFLTGREMEAGDTLIAYYDQTLPAVMIYPERYTAVAAAVNLDDSLGFKVAVFDSALVSDDGELTLNISDESTVLNSGGGAYTGKLAGAHIAVTYLSGQEDGVEAGQTVKAVVLKREVKKPAADKDLSEYLSYVPNAEVVVEDELIDCPAPFVTEDGVIMVPVRAVSEALGFEVIWNHGEHSITVGEDVSFAVGADVYTAQGVPTTLGTAPVLVNSHTYVPLNFFREVAGVNNAYYFEAQVVVNNGELME